MAVGSGCSLSGGRWFSYHGRVSWTHTSDVDIDHMVPLAEAWDSGARSWTTATRKAFANDLGDYRSLVGVTEFVAVKVRWRLTVDSAEKSAMSSLGSSCTNSTITVTRAR